MNRLARGSATERDVVFSETNRLFAASFFSQCERKYAKRITREACEVSMGSDGAGDGRNIRETSSQ